MKLESERKSEFLLLLSGVISSISHARGQEVVRSLEAETDEEKKEHADNAAKLRKAAMQMEAEYEDLRERFYDEWLTEAGLAEDYFDQALAKRKEVDAELKKLANNAKNIGKVVDKVIELAKYVIAFI